MEKKENNIPFELASIKVAEFATFFDLFKENASVNIEAKFEFGIDAIDRNVLVRFDSQFLCDDKRFVILKTDCVFKLNEQTFKSFFLNDKKVKIPKNILTHFCVLTVGTARGILHCKLEGSKLSFLLMPTINVTEVVTDDFIFDVD